MGSALHITFPIKYEVNALVKVKITYKTQKQCLALQWLDKECVGNQSSSCGFANSALKADAREAIPIPFQPVPADLCPRSRPCTRCVMISAHAHRRLIIFQTLPPSRLYVFQGMGDIDIH